MDKFPDAVRIVFSRWTVLNLAVENNWGGSKSKQKAEYLYEEVLDLFESTKGGEKVYPDELEDLLLDHLENEFHVGAEDGSVQQISKVLTDMWNKAKSNDFTLLQHTLGLSASKAAQESVRVKSNPDEEDDEEDEDDRLSDDDEDIIEEELEEENKKKQTNTTTAKQEQTQTQQPKVQTQAKPKQPQPQQQKKQTQPQQPKNNNTNTNTNNNNTNNNNNNVDKMEVDDEEDGWTTVKSKKSKQKPRANPKK